MLSQNDLLQAPDDYWSLTPEDKALICNGAGAKDGIKVPDTMYGLDLTECFNIHDYMYHIGVSFDDKRRADRTMLINCISVINNAPGLLNKLLAPLRRRRALKYYEAVYYFGGKAFEVNKKGA